MQLVTRPSSALKESMAQSVQLDPLTTSAYVPLLQGLGLIVGEGLLKLNKQCTKKKLDQWI